MAEQILDLSMPSVSKDSLFDDLDTAFANNSRQQCRKNNMACKVSERR
jgi:hypothetical protein